MAKKVYWLRWVDLSGRYKRTFDSAQARNAAYNQLVAHNKQMKPDDEFYASKIHIGEDDCTTATKMELLCQALDPQNNQKPQNSNRKARSNQ